MKWKNDVNIACNMITPRDLDILPRDLYQWDLPVNNSNSRVTKNILSQQ